MTLPWSDHSFSLASPVKALASRCTIGPVPSNSALLPCSQRLFAFASRVDGGVLYLVVLLFYLTVNEALMPSPVSARGVSRTTHLMYNLRYSSSASLVVMLVRKGEDRVGQKAKQRWTRHSPSTSSAFLSRMVQRAQTRAFPIAKNKTAACLF